MTILEKDAQHEADALKGYVAVVRKTLDRWAKQFEVFDREAEKRDLPIAQLARWHRWADEVSELLSDPTLNNMDQVDRRWVQMARADRRIRLAYIRSFKGIAFEEGKRVAFSPARAFIGTQRPDLAEVEFPFIPLMPGHRPASKAWCRLLERSMRASGYDTFIDYEPAGQRRPRRVKHGRGA